ncbi:MAG: PBP1A family penicillin-binding protein [Proteobacteria bacterium]|nr:PBP1A family penicillin-binding protein [Pseudomonadota bacterium]
MKRILIQAFFLFMLFSAISMAGLYYYLTKDLPSLGSIADYRPGIITKVYSDDGIQIGEFATEKREVIPISKAPARLIQSFVAAEDARFFEHEGLDFFSIFRAFLINLKAGGVVQGGSTITQQVAKSLLTSDRTFKRKFKEAVLAYRMENSLSKNDILYLYLNQIYLGHGAYGVQAAAENYFHKNVDELNLAEMAILAGLPQAPSKYSPATNPELARERQTYVLNRMVDEGYINVVESTDAMNTVIDVHPISDLNYEAAPYFTEHIRRYLEFKYGADTLYREGLSVFTSLHLDKQKAAQKALKKGLHALDKRQGYRGPIRNIAKEELDTLLEAYDKKLEKDPIEDGKIYEGIVTEVNSQKKYTEIKLGNKARGRVPQKDIMWARKPDPEVAFFDVAIRDPKDVFSVGDVVQVKVKGSIGEEGYLNLSLYQEPLVQGALLSIDPKNGFVRTMVGGFDFKKSKFNRAIQSRRQPGSSFKPVVYSAAIDKGYTPASIIMDSPIIYKGNEDALTWKPKNYEEKFYGPTTLRTALTKSRNIVTIKIMQDLGVDYVINYARRMGIKSHLNRDFSIALGSSGLSLLELTSAYSIFPGGGKRIEPIFITKIVDRDGNILEELSTANMKPEVLEEEKVDDEVVEEKETIENDEAEELKIVALPESLQNLPEGYAISPQTAYLMTNMLQGVVQHGTGWRAKQLGRPVGGKTGTTNDLFDAWFTGFTPDLVTGTWVGFDQEAPLGKYETGSGAAAPIWVDYMKEIYIDKPVEDFPIPKGITFTRIDIKSGLLAPPEQEEDVLFECFREGTAPKQFATQVTPDSGQFFRLDL